MINIATTKVNIGCGKTIAPGWINYDISLFMGLSRNKLIRRLLFAFKLISKQKYQTFWPSNIIRRDVRKGVPLLNESVDFVYSSHFLEHLTHVEASKLIKDCYRILKPGGWIRLVCPDLRLFARKYLEGDISYPLFHASNKARLSQGFIESLSLVDSRSILEKFFSPGFSHSYMYDFDSIANLLSESGFRVINECSFRKGVTPDLDKLDNRPDESLFVEAQKL